MIRGNVFTRFMIKLGVGSVLAALALAPLTASAQNAPANTAPAASATAVTTGTTAATPAPAAATTTGTTAVAPVNLTPSLVTDTITITTDTQPIVQTMLEKTTGTQTVGAQIVSATSGTLTGAPETLADILGTTATPELAPAMPPTTTTEPAPATSPLLTAPETEEPIYMQKRGEIQIFDPGRGQGISPLQQAAQKIREQAISERKPIQSKIYDVASYRYVLEGANEAAAIRDAQLRALKAASARVYFGNKIIIGRDLLQPYLARSGEKAIAQVLVDGKPHVLANGRIQMPIRVTVNVPLLLKDLEEKQFIAEPNIRPRMTIHVREMVEGRPTTDTLAMPKLAAAMENNLFRVHSQDMQKPALNVDLSKDPGQFQTARLEAERNNIDVILTGAINTMPVHTGQILYDNYHFWQTSLDLYLYRVDTGELIAHVQDSYSAAGDSDAHAIDRTLEEMVGRTGGRLATILRDMWPSTMLNEMDYRLMISGVNDARLERVTMMLRALAPDIRIYRKAYYGDVAVINIVLPEGADIDIESFLRHATDPQLIVRRYGDRFFEIEPIS